MLQISSRLQQWAEARRLRRITLDGARLRVTRGADYLDEVHPGWHRLVNAATLELSSGPACVLGQLHGDFRQGLSRSFLIHLGSAPRLNLSPVAYGFLCEQGVGEAVQAQDYDLLNQAWREAILQRQDEADDGETWLAAVLPKEETWEAVPV